MPGSFIMFKTLL